MATRDELLAAVRLISNHCKSRKYCNGDTRDTDCPLLHPKINWECVCAGVWPEHWPDPEGGGEE